MILPGFHSTRFGRLDTAFNRPDPPDYFLLLRVVGQDAGIRVRGLTLWPGTRCDHHVPAVHRQLGNAAAVVLEALANAAGFARPGVVPAQQSAGELSLIHI